MRSSFAFGYGLPSSPWYPQDQWYHPNKASRELYPLQPCCGNQARTQRKIPDDRPPPFSPLSRIVITKYLSLLTRIGWFARTAQVLLCFCVYLMEIQSAEESDGRQNPIPVYSTTISPSSNVSRVNLSVLLHDVGGRSKYCADRSPLAVRSFPRTGS
jgi:hypothetical protein